MAITDKTRKVLWGRSGNRCAICRQKLVVEQTDQDTESVVGDECHIISGAKAGPRYVSDFHQDEIDTLSNLLLLCRVHHKMIDDQYETYTAEVLRGIKSNHEKWVEEKLKDKDEIKPVRILRFRNEIPTQLPIIRSGRDLFNLATNCCGAYHNYSEDLTDDEVETIGGFLQNVQDWIDICADLKPIDKIRATKAIDDEIKGLENIGFVVFAAIEKQRLEGGVVPPSNFPVLHVSVIRKDDPSIVHVDDPGDRR